MNLEKQDKNLQELLQLARENPNLEIIPKVDCDLLSCCEDFSWVKASWGKAEIDEYWEKDEHIYLRSQDEDWVMDDVMDDIFVSEGYKEGDYGTKITEEELKEKANQVVNWTRAIFVRIEP